MRRNRVGIIGAVAVALAAMPLAGQAVSKPVTFVFNGEGNRLNAYDASTGAKQTVIWSAADAPTTDGRLHRDINAQICFFRDATNEHTYFIAGEDTGQGDEEGGTNDGGHPGWGIFELKGTRSRRVSDLGAEQKGKLVPLKANGEEDYGNTVDNPENYGCGQLDNRHLLTTDVGDQQPGAPGNGQLIVWFANDVQDLQRGFGVVNNIPQPSQVDYCKVDTTIATAGGMWVDHNDPLTASDDVVYVASARPADAQGWGIFRYTGLGLLESKADCARKDQLVKKSLFIPGNPMSMTPSAIAPSGRGTWYVSSVFDGNVAEYTTQGTFLRHVTGGPAPVTPPAGQLENFVAQLPLAGTPFGIGVAPDGTLWYAEMGVRVDGGPGPVDEAGSVKRVRFTGAGPLAVPMPPETVDASGLDFPDGIGVLTLD